MNEERLWAVLVPEQSLPALAKAGIGALMTVGAVLIRLPFEPWLAGVYPFASFFPAVLIASIAGGLIGGWVVVAFGGLLALWLFGSSAYIGGALIWLFMSGFLMWSGWTIRRFVRRLRESAYALKTANDRQKILLKEFEHRTRNSFSVVSALFNQTVRHSDSINEVSARFPRRLAALSASKMLLIEGFGEPVPLKSIVEAALAPFLAPVDCQIKLDGASECLVDPEACTGLTLALHELATNSMKYGALSVAEGRVGCAWELTREGECRFTWRETGGPAVSAPKKRGAGSILIESALANIEDGETELRFDPSGVVCRICFTAWPSRESRSAASAVPEKAAASPATAA